MRLSVLLSLAALPAAALAVGSAGSDGWSPRGTDTLSSLAVGQANQVLGVEQKGQRVMRFRRAEGGGSWEPFGPTSMKARRVAVSCTGDAWALGADGKLYRRVAFRGDWGAFAVPKAFASFDVGSGVDLWAVDSEGKPWRYDTAKKVWGSTEAKLASVAVSCKGDVMGVTGDGNLFKYEPEAKKWREVAKGITAITLGSQPMVLDSNKNVFNYVASAGGGASRHVRAMVNLHKRANVVASGPGSERWIVDLRGRAYEHTGLIKEPELNVAEKAALEAKQGGKWVAVPDSKWMRDFSTGDDGEIFAVTNQGHVRFLAGSGAAAKWTTLRVPVAMQQISVGCDGSTIFAIATDNKVYKYVGSGRWNVFSEKLRRVSVGADGRQVWGVNMGGRLVRWRPSSRTFAVEKGVNVRNIGASCDGSVWVVTRGGRLYQRSLRDPRLRYRGRGVRSVAVSPTETYILDKKRFLFRYRRPRGGQGEGKANWQLLHKQLRAVAVDSKGKLVGKAVDGSLTRFVASEADPADFGWKSLGASLDDVCLGSASNVFGLDKGTVLRYTASKTWAVVPGVTLASISCGCDGSVVGIKGPGLVYRYRSAKIGWERVPNSESIKAVSMGKNADKMFGVNHGNQPVQWDSSTATWTPIKGSVKNIVATCDNDLWAVAPNGDVLNHDEVTGHWARVGKGAKTVAAGRGVYVIGKNDRLFKYDTERKHNRWVSLGPARAVSAGDDGAVVALTRDRRAVWVNTGSLIAPGPELPPVLQHNPTDDLPPPEPDNASVSSLSPGQEPELGAGDDIDGNLEQGAIRHAIAARNEGASGGDPSDPEPYRPQGVDPDDPDSKPANAGPSKDVAQSFDAATDATRIIDGSNP